MSVLDRTPGRHGGAPLPRLRRQPGLLLPDEAAGPAVTPAAWPWLVRLPSLARCSRPRRAARRAPSPPSRGRRAQRRTCCSELEQVHGYRRARCTRVREIFAALALHRPGQPGGHASIPRRPEACAAKLRRRRASPTRTRSSAICGGPLHGAALRPGEKRPEQARACIDQFEFPDIPCELPGRLDARERGRRSCARRSASGSATRTSGRGPAPARCWRPTTDSTWPAGADPRPAVAPDARRAQRAHAARQVAGPTGPPTGRASARPSSHKTPGCPGGELGPLRLEHLPGRLLPRVPQPARRLRPERQRRRAHEPAARREPDGEPRQPRSSA